MGIGRAFREALVGLWRTGTVGLVSAASIGASLWMLGTFIQVLGGAHELASTLRNRVEVDIYLEPGTRRREALGLLRHVEAREGVAGAVYVDASQAAEEFRSMFGAGLLDVLSTNPLPASIRVQFHPDRETTTRARALAEAVRRRDGVESVDVGEAWLDSLDRVLDTATWMCIGLGVVLCVACAFAVSNTAKLMVLAQREAIEIMRLVGARNGFIRMTFLLGGALQGFIGGAVAAALVVSSSGALSAWMPFEVSLPVAAMCGVTLALGSILGVLGSWTSLNRVLQAVA